jgi:hypothetical protein
MSGVAKALIRASLFSRRHERSLAMSQTNGASSREPRAVLRKDAARQGVTGHNVRYVLVYGLAAAVVALAAIYFVYFG